MLNEPVLAPRRVYSGLSRLPLRMKRRHGCAQHPLSPAQSPLRKLYVAIVDRHAVTTARTDGSIRKTGAGQQVFRGPHEGNDAVAEEDRASSSPTFAVMCRGDDLRFVDWNLYARLDKLFLKLFLEEEDLHVFFVVDASPSMDFGDPSKFYFAKQMAAALGFVGMCRGDRVKIEFLGIENKTSPVMRGRSQLPRMLDFVQGVEPNEVFSLTDSIKRFCLRNTGRGIIVLLTDLMDKRGYEPALRLLVGQQMDIFVLHILSPEEMEPDLKGDLKLIDCEDNDEAEISVSTQLMKKYKQTLAAFVDQARKFCAQRGIAYLLARSDQGADVLVSQYLRERGLVR
ncbi:MAG: DUF58 domain-containing protein [Pirellulales bacterium]